MKYAALTVLLGIVLAGALFLRTDRHLGVKRISYSFYKDELYDDFYRQAGVDFQAQWNREHPDDPIEVRYEPIGGDYGLKINAEIVAGTVQDIFFTWDFNTYVRRGTLLDLTPYVEKYHAQPQLDKIYPELIKAHTVNGRLYGLPNNLNTDVLYYNRALFDREKMPYPRWTARAGGTGSGTSPGRSSRRRPSSSSFSASSAGSSPASARSASSRATRTHRKP